MCDTLFYKIKSYLNLLQISLLAMATEDKKHDIDYKDPEESKVSSITFYLF